MRRLTVFFALAALTSTTVLVLVLAGKGHDSDAVAWGVSVVSLVMLFAPLALKRTDTLSLWWARQRARLGSGMSLPWRLTVVLRGEFSDLQLFERIERGLVDRFGNRARIVMPRAVNGLRVTVDGVGFVEMSLDEVSELDATALTIDISGLTVAPHEALRRLEADLVPLVRCVEAAAQAGTREQSWSLKVDIDDQANPFLPLYLRDRDPGAVDLFRVGYKRDSHTGDRIDLTKEGIYLAAGTVEGFQALVRDFVTFSAEGVKAPVARA